MTLMHTEDPSPSGSSGTCALHIRLFDGTSVRKPFAANATLSSSVRPAIQQHSHTDQPYNFRLIGRPPRTIEASEEILTLRELGLCPNATLVLVPVRGFADAYASAGATGVVQQGLGMGWTALSGMANVVSTLVGRAVGYGITGAHPSGFSTAGDYQQAAESSQAPDPTEAYNGNQLSLQPRPGHDK